MNPQDIEHRLQQLNQGLSASWVGATDRIQKTFVFEDFKAAMAFMQRVAHDADALDHHPEWRNVYNRIEVELTTHSAGGVTELDFALAAKMEAACAAVSP